MSKDENEIEIAENFELNPKPQIEVSKRRREIFLIFAISLLLVVLVSLEVYVFRSGQSLPAPYVIYFIALVNFNLVLVLFLLFLIFRNVVKIFLERRSKFYGSSLKSKLTIAFAAFSVIPTALVLIISVFYLNSSFEKWFSQRMAGVLKNASEVVDAFVSQEKSKGFEYGQEISDLLAHVSSSQQVELIARKQRDYKLDALEYYPDILSDRIIFQDQEKVSTIIPRVNIESLKKVMQFKAQNSYVQVFSDAHLLRLMVPVQKNGSGVVVVTKVLSLSSEASFNDIIGSYTEFESNLSIQTPLKSMYFIMLIVMSLVTLFAAVWFGFHLAKQLSVPLVQLGRATRKVAGGDYSRVAIQSGSDEINSLIGHFNQMITQLSSSELELQQTLKNLHQYTKYVEIVLTNVSAGVISVDMFGQVTTINRRASELLQADPAFSIGKHVKLLLSDENYKLFAGYVRLMRENNLSSLEKEIKLDIKKEVIPLSIHISILKNELQEEIGRILVFDDMTLIVNAQRAAAWSEVARRIAHEIKNPLTPIRLAAERMHRKYSAAISDKAFDESIQMIVSQVDEMKNLVNEFSQFARMPQLKPIPGSLNEILAKAGKIYRDNNSQVVFEERLDSTMPDFKFDPSQMNRVFMNLIDNAVMATVDVGQPRIGILTEYIAEHKIIKITISDNGVGIPVRDRVKVFEPYFSTKEKGTGLGLSIVKSIIEDHSGVIRALPNEPTGTKMYIELPVIT
jgi:two-component system, NtrC family, nitrogen regulation sensor histidine kinase NtrY